MIWFLTFLPEEKNVMSIWMYSLDLERHKWQGFFLRTRPRWQANCPSGELPLWLPQFQFGSCQRAWWLLADPQPSLKNTSGVLACGERPISTRRSNAAQWCLKYLQILWLVLDFQRGFQAAASLLNITVLLLNFGLRSVFRKQSNNIKGATAFVHHLLDAQHVFPSLKNTFVWGEQFEKQTLRKCVFSSTKRWNETRETRLLFSRLGGLAVSRVGLLWGALQKGPAELPRFEARGNRIGKI